jgi:hypothetical protein
MMLELVANPETKIVSLPVLPAAVKVVTSLPRTIVSSSPAPVATALEVTVIAMLSTVSA